MRFAFFGWERFAGIRRSRGLAAEEWGDLRGLVPIQTGRAENGANLARSVFVKLKHAVIQARIRRCRVFVGRDLFVCPRAGEERQGVSGYCFT